MASRYSVRDPRRVAGIMEPGDVVVSVPISGGSTAVFVHTWADSFGAWHCRFQSSDSARRDAHIARLAIGHELGQRGDKRFSLSRRFGKTDLPGVVHYAER